MQQIDSTALSTALPTLARAFHTNPVNLKVALTCYIVTQAVFIPASGWIADRFGARRVFMGAMGVFLLGSILCGFSHSLGALVASRIIQGLGGAAMTPVGRIIVVGAFRREDLMHAMIWLTTPAMVGPILGPPLAGLILSFTDWPWIFFINVPIGLLGLMGVLRFVPKRMQPHPGRFDFKGFYLSAFAISATMIGAEGIGLLSPWMLAGAWIIALGLCASYALYARGRDRPVLDLSLMRYKTLRASLTGGSLFRFSMGATPFLLPLLLQGGLGWTPLHAGLLTMTSAMGAMLSRPGAVFIIGKLGYRNVLLITSVVGGILSMGPILLIWGTPIWIVVVSLIVAGLFRSSQFTSLNTIAFAEVPNEAISATTTLMAVLQQVSLSLGITLAGLALGLSQWFAHAKPGHNMAPSLFIAPFVLINLLPMTAALIYSRLPKDAGATMIARRPRG